MDQISVLAASGLRARMESLDLLANNMANSSTSGYKGDGEFYTLFTSDAAEPDASGTPSTLPMIERQWTDFSQGLLEQTNNPLDLGLSGKGFFSVKGPSGTLYTRNGGFHLSRTGTLSNGDGYPVLVRDGKTLTVDKTLTADPTQPIEVGVDGEVRQKGQTLGQLQLVEFKDSSLLLKQGSNYFRNTGDQAPVLSSTVQVNQGQIESSNVSAAHGAVRLVGVIRQFEMMQKAISISNDMGRKAIEEVAKV